MGKWGDSYPYLSWCLFGLVRQRQVGTLLDTWLVPPCYDFSIFLHFSHLRPAHRPPSPILKRMTEVGAFNPLPYQSSAAAVVITGIFLVAAAYAAAAAFSAAAFSAAAFSATAAVFPAASFPTATAVFPLPPLPLFWLLSLLLFL